VSAVDDKGRMRNGWAAAVLAVAMAAVGPLAGAASAREARRFPVGSWSVSVNVDARGALENCTAAASYQSGVVLLFLIKPDETWMMALAGASVRTLGRRGAVVPAALRVDGLNARMFDGRLIDTELLAIRMPDDDAMFDALRQGRQLLVAAGGRSFVFNLTDTYAMLTALYRCATSGVGGDPEPPPVASAVPPAPAWCRPGAASS